VRQKPYSLILFDEIEKAHENITLILLQIMDEGRLTDGRGNTVRFSESLIIMTSNLGARHLAVPVLTDENKEAAMEDVRAHFRPEFLNRLDDIVMFNALSDESLANIMRLMLRNEMQMLMEQRGITLNITDPAIKWLIGQNDEPEYGARPLKRIIRRFLREPLAEFLIETDPPAGIEVKVGTAAKKKGGGLKFSAVINGQEVAVEG
jgi:ATP-dependent Clp protease ATP-binding subunit ClpA